MYLVEDEDEKLDCGFSQKPSITHNNPQSTLDIRMSSEFKAAFRFIAKHYRCSDAEIALMKAIAKADLESAMRCYLALEKEIVGPAKGINERIRAAIASQA